MFGVSFVLFFYFVLLFGQEIEFVVFEIFEVFDMFVLFEGYEWCVIVQFGDCFGSDVNVIDFGINVDYIGFLLMDVEGWDFWFFVNYEYVLLCFWFDSFVVVYGVQLLVIELQRDDEYL